MDCTDQSVVKLTEDRLSEYKPGDVVVVKYIGGLSHTGEIITIAAQGFSFKCQGCILPAVAGLCKVSWRPRTRI